MKLKLTLPKIKKYLVVILPAVGLLLLFLIFKPQKPFTIPPENPQRTIGWREYKNDDFHFSFRYPEGELSNFSVLENDLGSKTFQKLAAINHKKLDPTSYNVVFEAGAVKSDGKFEEFIKNNLPETHGIKPEKIILGDTHGLRFTNINTKADGYYLYNLFQKGDIIYNFALISDDPILINGNKPLLENILTTVKFK